MNSAKRQGVLSRLWTWTRSPQDMKIVRRGETVGVVGVEWARRFQKIEPTYSDMVERYLAEGRIKCAIDELTDISVGHGFHLTCAAGYENAMEAVGDFCEDVDLDGLNLMMARDVWITGNMLVWKRVPDKIEDLLRIPINSVTHVRSDRFGNVTELKQHFKGGEYIKVEKDEVGELIRWIWNPIDTGVIGRGLLEPYVRQGAGYKIKTDDGWKTAYRPSLAEIVEEFEDMMRVAITRYAPRFIFELGGFTEEQRTNLAKEIGKMTWFKDIVLNYEDTKDMKFALHRMSTDPRSRLDPFIEHFTNKELITTQTPSVKLISETGFTEASAKVAREIEEGRVAAYQRFHKRKVERDIFRPILVQQMGYGPEQIKKANIRMNWGPVSKPRLTIEQLLKAAELGTLSREEARANLSEYGAKLLEQIEEK